jgi:hypothetical protein
MRNPQEIIDHLDYLKEELLNERLSYGEILDLSNLIEHIDPSDIQLLEAAGVPEFANEPDIRKVAFMGESGAGVTEIFTRRVAQLVKEHTLTITENRPIEILPKQNKQGYLIDVPMGLFAGSDSLKGRKSIYGTIKYNPRKDIANCTAKRKNRKKKKNRRNK